MTKEVAALTLTVLVHFVGLCALVYALLGEDPDRRNWRGWWPRDDEGDPPPKPSGPPLPDARPARVRLRDDRRLGDAVAPPERRPTHPPRPAREREPNRR